MEEPNLFRLLSDDWQATARGPAAVAACAEWAHREPVLSGFASPAEVVAGSHDCGDPARSAALLRAVLTQIGTGPWPARTVLRSVLPGLAVLARRGRWFVGPSTPWQRRDELDHEIVAIAYERITAMAVNSPPWPASAIVNGTWRRLRTVAAARRRWHQRECPLDGTDPVADNGLSVTVADELADALVTAVEKGILQHNDGWLIYANRARGRSMEDLGLEVGRSASWAWHRRVEAERLLRAVGPALFATAG